MVAQSSPADLALSWVQKGFSVIPVPHKTKAPILPDWPNLRLTEEDISLYFNGDPTNMGLLLGGASHSTIDVDFDTIEAIAAAEIFFPMTCGFGRKSRPKSHLLYKCKGATTKKYTYDGATLLELRSTGCQTILPGSTHPSSEKVEWSPGPNKITPIDEATLMGLAGKTAAAALLAREWEKMAGSRHDTILALSGALLHSGWSDDDVLQFLGGVVTVASYPERKDRMRAVATTIEKHSRNEEITGWPRVSEYFDESAIKKVRDWLSIQADNTHGLIISNPGVPDEWPEVQPLRRELPPAEPFPLDALVDILSPIAVEMTNVIQAPDAVCAQSILAAAALAVQAVVDIEIDGRVSPLSEYFLTLAETGDRKTAADQAALAPHRKFQRALLEKYAEETAEYEADQASWKKAREQALSAKLNDTRGKKREALLELGAEPQPPIHPILMTEEPTYEGLVKALMNGWPSMGIFSDEGGRFLGGCGMNAENMLKTAAGLSSLWSGTPISRTRGGDGNTVLYGRRVAMHLMVQPTVSHLLFDNEMLIGQGLLSRCLVAYPVSTIGNRPYKAASLSNSPAAVQYFARIMEILEAPLPLVKGTQNELEPRTLSLCPAAKTTWIAFHDHIEALSIEGKELHRVRGLAAKTAEHALRISGVFALLDDLHAQNIKESHIEAATELTQFYLGEALRLFEAVSDNADLMLAEKLLTWLRQKAYKAISLQQVYQSGPYAIRNKATALRMLGILFEHGQVRPASKANVWEVRDGVVSQV